MRRRGRAHPFTAPSLTQPELVPPAPVVIEGEHRYIPFKVLKRLEGLPQAVAEGKPLPETIRLTAEGEAARKGG